MKDATLRVQKCTGDATVYRSSRNNYFMSAARQDVPENEIF